MKIGDLSRAAGVDVDNIRFHEQAGLLAAPARDANGYRRGEACPMGRASGSDAAIAARRAGQPGRRAAVRRGHAAGQTVAGPSQSLVVGRIALPGLGPGAGRCCDACAARRRSLWRRGETGWLAGAVVSGGVAGPVLLMLGLAGMPASAASLLLNAEGVFTALLAWFVFRENVDRRIALGMGAIVAGGLVLSWPGQSDWPGWQPTLLVTAACLAWAIDNNLTRKVALADASWIAMVKGLVAGATNLVLALALGAAWPATPVVFAAALVGFASYGASLALFVVGLRELGTARTGAYFSVAPFFGAILAIALLGEAVSRAIAGGGRADGAGRGAAPVGAARTSACARADGAQPRACARRRRSAPRARPRAAGRARHAPHPCAPA